MLCHGMSPRFLLWTKRLESALRPGVTPAAARREAQGMSGRAATVPALPAASQAPAPALIALGRRLPVIAIGALLGTLLVLVAQHLVQQDTWLALVSGREIAQHGLPTANHLTVIGFGRPWTDQQWLAQIAMYGLVTLGGIRLLVLAHILTVVGAFAFAIAAARARGASPRSITLLAVFAVGAAPWAFLVRAQAPAMLLFVAILYLLLTDPEAARRRTLLALPLLCVWANLHGSVVLGAEVVFAFGEIAAVSGIRRGSGRAVVHGGALLLAPLAVLASPYAGSLVGYYRLMLIDPPFAGHNVEWARTRPEALTAVFFALAVGTLILLVLRRRRFSSFEIVVLLLTLATAVFAVRGIIWFALAALAIVPAALMRAPAEDRLATAAAGVTALLAAAAFAIFAVVHTPGSETHYGSLRPEAATFVAAHAGASGRVLADDVHADWLLWREPSLRGRVAYDVRFELLSRPEIIELSNFEDSRGTGWPQIGGQYELVVADWPRVAALVNAGRARLLYRDGTTAVAQRLD